MVSDIENYGAKCLRLANECKAKAENASRSEAKCYLEIMREWLALADAYERRPVRRTGRRSGARQQSD